MRNDDCVRYIGSKAVEAMLMEAVCAPAPGLVDRYNSGAHTDMDIFTFMRSTAALGPAMYSCAACGYMHENSLPALLRRIRPIGRQAETDMFAATDGVNTQKGLLFVMGILCAATGAVYHQVHSHEEAITAEKILAYVKEMCRGLVAEELGTLKIDEGEMTAGQRLFKQYGIRGIRGEVEDGLPAVLYAGLPAYEEAKQAGFSNDVVLLHALLALMTVVEDTTIVHRHNLKFLRDVQADAQRIMSLGGALTEEGFQAIVDLDANYSSRRISPGGSADLLAVTHFLYEVTA